MKKLLILLIPAIVLSGLAVVATNHYNNYQHKVTTARQVVVDQQAQALAAEQAASAHIVAAYSTLHLECEKGSASYNALTSALQKKIPAPSCGPAIAQ